MNTESLESELITASYKQINLAWNDKGVYTCMFFIKRFCGI